MTNMALDARRRRAWVLLTLMLTAAWVMVVVPRQLAAQDEKKAAPKAEKAEKAAPEDDKAVADAEKPADEGEKPAAAEEGTAKKAAPPENFLIWVAKCSGFIGAVILLLSVYFVSTVGRLFWEMRIEVAAPPELVQQCESLLEQRDFKGVYNAVKDDESFFGRLLTTGIAELPNGLSEAREAMERMGDAITAEMEKKISMLAVLGTLGPMIGLLGTLKGMIGSFGVIGRSAGSGIDPSEVANKISEALLLTFEGVALSVPAIYFFALFRNRVIHISSSVTISADQFLRHFSHAGRAKASTTAPSGKPPT
jgi:biopolymer transport protein ExbB